MFSVELWLIVAFAVAAVCFMPSLSFHPTDVAIVVIDIMTISMITAVITIDITIDIIIIIVMIRLLFLIQLILLIIISYCHGDQ